MGLKYEDLEHLVAEAKDFREQLGRMAEIEAELRGRLGWMPPELVAVREDFARGLDRLRAVLSQVLDRHCGKPENPFGGYFTPRPLDAALAGLSALEDERDRHRDKAMLLKAKVQSLQAELLDQELREADEAPGLKDRLLDKHADAGQPTDTEP